MKKLLSVVVVSLVLVGMTSPSWADHHCDNKCNCDQSKSKNNTTPLEDK